MCGKHHNRGDSKWRGRWSSIFSANTENPPLLTGGHYSYLNLGSCEGFFFGQVFFSNLIYASTEFPSEGHPFTSRDRPFAPGFSLLLFQKYFLLWMWCVHLGFVAACGSSCDIACQSSLCWKCAITGWREEEHPNNPAWNSPFAMGQLSIDSESTRYVFLRRRVLHPLSCQIRKRSLRLGSPSSLEFASSLFSPSFHTIQCFFRPNSWGYCLQLWSRLCGQRCLHHGLSGHVLTYRPPPNFSSDF